MTSLLERIRLRTRLRCGRPSSSRADNKGGDDKLHGGNITFLVFVETTIDRINVNERVEGKLRRPFTVQGTVTLGSVTNSCMLRHDYRRIRQDLFSIS